MTETHDWKVIEETLSTVVMQCTKCNATTNNAFLAWIYKNCPGKPKAEAESEATKPS